MKYKPTARWKLKPVYYTCLLCEHSVAHSNSLCDHCAAVLREDNSVLDK